MTKPRIIIADLDENYIVPFKLKFVEDFFEKVELEIITDVEYFNLLFLKPQKADVLIVSENLYNNTLHKHNIGNIFLMTEHINNAQTADLSLNYIYKYTSVKEIINEIVSKSIGIFGGPDEQSKETQIVLVYSAPGGVGKTTLSMGLAGALTNNHKKVLYLNASRLQAFAHLLNNCSPITSSDVYLKLRDVSQNAFEVIKHVIRKEKFDYLPPFKASLMSLDIKYSTYKEIINSIKSSKIYDYIIVDSDIVFDEEKAELFNISNKVLILTKQDTCSVMTTNLLVSNINELSADKYIFICSEFNKEKYNALVSPKITPRFTISEYIDYVVNYEKMSIEDFARESSIQRIAFLLF